MQVFGTKTDLKSFLSTLDKKKQTVGLVPTMGALHQGHCSLVKKAVNANDFVIVTIFVNPTQFDNQQDLTDYPNTLKKDLSLLAEISEEIIVFSPSISEIYGTDVTAQKYDFGGLEKVMEGAFRDGHFDGVGTIVEALLKMVMPHRAYFGEKDFQQLQIIKKLVQIKEIPVAIIGCPIVREPHGLAMSSRNERLSPALRKEAAFIYQTLQQAKVEFGTKSAKEVEDWVHNKFKAHANLTLEYIAIRDVANLQPALKKVPEVKYRAFIAVYAEDVRLIDNIALN